MTLTSSYRFVLAKFSIDLRDLLLLAIGRHLLLARFNRTQG